MTADAEALFIAGALRDLARCRPGARVLDFGCGRGELVQRLFMLGYEAHGCDLVLNVPSSPTLRRIQTSPYRLPYDDESFDAIVSTSVLEHAQNKEECFHEMHRVLRAGGVALHLYPGKWYLPYEPHICVPLVNWIWPRVGRAWLGLWALLGVRNEFQRGQSWKEVMDANARYCQSGLSYWSNRRIEALARGIFGRCDWPMRYYVTHAPGGFGRLARRLPARSVLGWISKNFRMALLRIEKTK